MDVSSIQTIFIVFSTISGVSSLIVLATAALFSEMRNKMFMHIIIIVSACDFIASAASAFGFPKNSSPLCPTQSVLTTFFYRASWFWTVVLNYQLYNVMMSGKLGVQIKYMHAICWSIAFLITIFPLFLSTPYGRDDDANGHPLGWCFVSSNNWETFNVVYWVTFAAPLLISIILMTILSTRVIWRFRNEALDPVLYGIIDMLRLYPVAMAFNWTPNVIISILLSVGLLPYSSTNAAIFNIITILATQNGTLTTLIFFVKSKEARFRWRKLLGLADVQGKQSNIGFSLFQKRVLISYIDTKFFSWVLFS